MNPEQLKSTLARKLSWINPSLVRSGVVKNIAILFTSTTYAQFLPFLLAPIIARLYDPLDYAIFAALTSITVISTTMATGMYDTAIMLDREDDTASNTAVSAFLFTIVVSLLTVVLVFLFQHQLARLVKNSDIIQYLWLVPVMTFITGLYRILNIWTNRKKRYPRMSMNRIIQSSLAVVLQIIFGALHWGGRGLIYSNLIAISATVLLLFWQTARDDARAAQTVTLKGIRHSFAKHKDFPFFNMPQGLMDGLRESSVLIIIANFFGPSVLGSYSFASNILMKPLRFIGDAVGQVYFQHASSEYNRTGKIRGVFSKTLFSIAAIGLPFFLILGLFGQRLFGFVFSSKWDLAGLYSQILAVWFFLRFVISPVSSTPVIFNRQKHFFLVSILINVLPPVSLFLMSRGDYIINSSLAVFAVVNSTMYLLMLLWFISLIRKNGSSCVAVPDIDISSLNDGRK